MAFCLGLQLRAQGIDIQISITLIFFERLDTIPTAEE